MMRDMYRRDIVRDMERVSIERTESHEKRENECCTD